LQHVKDEKITNIDYQMKNATSKGTTTIIRGAKELKKLGYFDYVI